MQAPSPWWPLGFFIALCAACSEASDTHGDSALDLLPGDETPLDAGAEASDDTPLPEVWEGTFRVPFRSSLVAHTASELMAIDQTDNVGTVTVSDITRFAFSAQTVDWTQQTGYRLVHVFATDEENLDVAFVYCLGGRVDSVWYESLTSPMTNYADVGTHPCPVTTETHDIVVRARPLRRLPEGLNLVTGVTVHGADVEVTAEGMGSITLAGIAWTLVLFGYVDCPQSLCGAPGWYELHSLLRGPGGATAFDILYLMRDDTAHVRTSHGLRFDVPSNLPNVMLSATWSVP